MVQIIKLMIKLNFIYSKDQDVSNVINLIGDIDWIVKNKYNVILPSLFSINNLADQKKEDTESAVCKEYDQKVYFDIEKKLRVEWDKIDHSLEMGINKINKNALKEFNIYLTKYGFVGGYELPNEVIINITSRTVDQMAGSIAHEIIHLNIESLIQKYKIEHWTKERIVNLISLKIFPTKFKLQRDPENSELIGKYFEQYYPDIEKMISAISGVHGRRKGEE